MNHPVLIKKLKTKHLWLLLIPLAGLALVWHGSDVKVKAAELGQRAMQLNDNAISHTSDYQLSFNITTPGTLGSIKVQFCSNSPLVGAACTAPGGFSASSAVLASQTGPGGFSISGASTVNNIILSRTAAAASAGPAEFHFTDITNPSTPGSYFVRVQTYSSEDATGPATDSGGIAFAITNALSVTATVPPYLIFCTGVTIGGLNCTNAVGDYIDLGELSSKHASSASSQMLAATNAADGYSVTVNGNTMTSGVNSISQLLSNDVSRPGTGQFGLNLRANVAPAVGANPTGPGLATPQPIYNQPNSYRFVSGEVIVNRPAPDNLRKFTASYLVNIPAIQPPGVYVSTLTYICVGDF